MNTKRIVQFLKQPIKLLLIPNIPWREGYVLCFFRCPGLKLLEKWIQECSCCVWFVCDLTGCNLLIIKCYLNVAKPQFQVSMCGKINKLIGNMQIKILMKPHLLIKAIPSFKSSLSLYKYTVISWRWSQRCCLSQCSDSCMDQGFVDLRVDAKCISTVV